MSEVVDAGTRHSPLEDVHRSLGAKMAPFAGWLMPIEYAGTLVEHTAVREAVGMFDVSHMGKLTIEGPAALDVVQRTFTNDASGTAKGVAQYTMALNDAGGIVDDLIVYRLGEDRFLVVPNAANVEKILDRVAANVPAGTHMVARPDLALVAVQGPRSKDLVSQVFPEALWLSYMRCNEVTWRDLPVVVARTGYTGEVGFEIFVPSSIVVELWNELSWLGESLGLRPAGLAARDTLRTEMGYPLHGNDISESTTPLEAGLSWAVSFDKGDFTGRAALLAQREAGVPRRLTGLRMDDRLIPRPHYGVFVGDERVGETTSGTFSPTLKRGIALAYLAPPGRFAPGDRVRIDVRGRDGEAEVTKPPFVLSTPRS